MSTLRQVFVRGHHRYDLDLYASDLERFAAWLIGKGSLCNCQRIQIRPMPWYSETAMEERSRDTESATCCGNIYRTTDPRPRAGRSIRTPCGTLRLSTS